MRGILLTTCAAAAAPPISPFKVRSSKFEVQSSKLYLPLSLLAERGNPIYHVDYDLSLWAGPK